MYRSSLCSLCLFLGFRHLAQITAFIVEVEDRLDMQALSLPTKWLSDRGTLVTPAIPVLQIARRGQGFQVEGVSRSLASLPPT
jgi:hypothetical protein